MRLINSVVVAIVFSISAAAQVGNIATYAGSPTASGSSGDSGAATAALLTTPQGVAVDTGGNLYIADTGNSKIRKVNATTGVITTFAGNGTSGSTGDGAVASDPVVSFTSPTGVAVDATGNVYIADQGAAKVRMVSTTGVITTFAGTGFAGFSGDGGAATSAQLNAPSAVAVDASGNVYIADSANHRIRKVSGGTISTFAGNASLGFAGDNVAATTTSLFSPRGVAVDSTGNVYIADTFNNRVRKVSGNMITTIAGTGVAGYSGDGGAANSAAINNPRSLALDSSGSVFVADTQNNVVRRIANNAISTVAGTGISGFAGDGGPSTSARFNFVAGVAVDPTGSFTYIADTNNNAVRVFANAAATSGVIPHFAAGGSYVTGLYVVNKSNLAQTFNINFYNDAGAPLVVPSTGGTVNGAALSDTIPAYGSGYYELGKFTAPTLLGGSGTIQSSTTVVVQTVFRHQGAAPTPYEAAFTATQGSLESVIAFDATTDTATGAQIYTGFAIANADGANTATVTCVARDNTGTIIPNAVTVPALNPQGHWAAYNFPALVGKRGTIDCTSTTRMAMIALRAIGTDAISALPVILK